MALKDSLILIGTSHIAQDSIDRVKRAISEHAPDIVAVELDQQRLYALKHNVESKLSLRDIPSIGLQGYVFARIGQWVQKKLGNVVGIQPGSDMLAAVQTAREHEAEIALIDRDISLTLSRFSQNFGWREKLNVVKELFTGLLGRKKLPFDIRHAPSEDVIEGLLEEVRREYPGVYKALITERNYYMANNLWKLHQQEPDKRIVAIIGAGHKKGMEQLLESWENVSSYTVTYSV